MDQIKKTLITLKARWPEVALIISIFLLVPIMAKRGYNFREEQRRYVDILFLIVNLSALLASTILGYGFLRTVYLENTKRQSISVLFRIGKKFFWRMVGFGLLYMLPMYIIYGVLSRMSGHLSVQWTFSVWELLLIKIILLVPALIIVFDIGIFESFKKLKNYKILDAKPLIALFLIHIALPLIWLFVLKFGATAMVSNLILDLFRAFVSKFLLLMIAVTAVRFVALGAVSSDDVLE